MWEPDSCGILFLGFNKAEKGNKNLLAGNKMNVFTCEINHRGIKSFHKHSILQCNILFVWLLSLKIWLLRITAKTFKGATNQVRSKPQKVNKSIRLFFFTTHYLHRLIMWVFRALVVHGPRPGVAAVGSFPPGEHWGQLQTPPLSTASFLSNRNMLSTKQST
jgi:hypothetical protein